MEREAAKEAYDELHKEAQYHDGTFQRWSKVRSHQHPYRYDAGVTIGAAETDLTPWDRFTTERDASPLPDSKHDGDN